MKLKISNIKNLLKYKLAYSDNFVKLKNYLIFLSPVHAMNNELLYRFYLLHVPFRESIDESR